jgi:hypothetical protein
MTYAPTQILGPIVPISNSSAKALPGITQSGAGGAEADFPISFS